MEYYLVIKKNEILPFATTWLELQGTMLSEISQSEKEKYRRISLICRIYETKQMTKGKKRGWEANRERDS